MTDTHIPKPTNPLTPEQINAALANLQTLADLTPLLREVLRDQEQTPVSDMIKDYIAEIRQISHYMAAIVSGMKNQEARSIEMQEHPLLQQIQELLLDQGSRISSMENSLKLISALFGRPLT